MREIVAEHDGPADPDIAFLHADYRSDLDLPDDHFDLLVSLYAGFITEHCTRHLRVGGALLANPSHGDAAMASIDPRYELAGVVDAGGGRYRVSRNDLDTYLIPKKQQLVTVETLRESGRGVGYTKSPFAYLFSRNRAHRQLRFASTALTSRSKTASGCPMPLMTSRRFWSP